MLPRSIPLGAALLLAGAAPAASQRPPEGKKAAPPERTEPFPGRLADAKLAALERNVPLLVHILLEGEEHNDEYRDQLLPNKDLVAASAGLVVVVSNNGTHEKKTVEIEAPDGTKTRKEVCSAYGTDSCAVHQGTWDDLYREYQGEDGGMTCPQTIVLLPDGSEHWRRNEGHPPPLEELIGALDEARRKAGPGISAEQLAQAKRLWTEGQGLVDRKRWPEAWATWRSLAAITHKNAWGEAAVRGEPEAEKAARAEIEALAARLVPGQAAAAYAALLEYQGRCAGLPVEKELAARLKKAEREREIRDEIEAWKTGVEADAILAEVQALVDQGEEKKALRLVRKLFSRKYAETDASRTARELWPDVAAEEDAKQKKPG